ncbi:MAG: SDR family oxidoreductase [Pigmentiphaga sp.]
MKFKNKVVVVTGAGSGFGRGIAECFAAEGANVVVADVNAEGGRQTAEALEAKGVKAMFVACDVTRSADMKGLVNAVLERLGRLDVFVNNAGVSHRIESMSAVSEDEFDRVMDINVKSLYLSAKYVAPHFISQGGGCFVNIGSVSANRPRPGIAWYAASKAAAIVASRSMALELAPHGIRVNVINPVAGDTPFLGAHGQDSPDLREKFVASIPLGRLAVPADIGHAAVFLASEEASLITGASLDVDGGRSI